MDAETTWIAFANQQRIAQGAPREVALALKQQLEQGQTATPLIFNATTGEQVDFNPDYLPPESTAVRSVGRPKLGVVPREVTLLPRHWEWLAAQSSSASTTLRQLVEQAMRTPQAANQERLAQEAAYRFMSAIAGNEQGFEEATRALFARQYDVLQKMMSAWPQDVRTQIMVLVGQVPA